MAIKNADTTLQSAPKEVVQPHPLCGDALPTNEFCEGGRPPPLDQYKEYSDWVPIFYAPPQYHFCKTFKEWYYRSCVPATQEAREDIRDIAQKNGDAGSKKEITEQINGTFNRTENACAGIDPNILKETADRCDTIVNIHNKNRLIMGLAAVIIVKGLFTVHAIRHTSRSWSEMKAVARNVWNEAKNARAEEGVWVAAKRLWKGIGQVWNARESDFREQVTDINIFFAKLLEFSDSKEDRAAAIAKWNEVKKQKSLSAEKKFERFKDVIREEFGKAIFGMIYEIEGDIIKELIFQSAQFERLASSLEADEEINYTNLISEVSGTIKKLHETLQLFMANTGLFEGSKELHSELLKLSNLTGNFLQVLADIDNAIKHEGLLHDKDKGLIETITRELRSYDLRRIDSIVRLAAKLVDSHGFIQMGEMPQVVLQETSDILGIYTVVQNIIRSFNEFDEISPYQHRDGSDDLGGVTVSASIKNGIIKLQIKGVKKPVVSHYILNTAQITREHGWAITVDHGAVVLSIPEPARGERRNSEFRKIMGAIQGLHFAAVHFKFEEAVEFTRNLLERLDEAGTEPVAAAFTGDILPIVDKLYSKFEMEFYEDLFPRIGDYMGQLSDALKKENHERLVEYFSGNITTVLRYAGYLSDNLRGFAQLLNIQRMLSSATLTPEWRGGVGKFWGIIHDIGNVLQALRLSIDSAVEEGSAEALKGFNLLSLNGVVRAVESINEKAAKIKNVDIIMDVLPELAIPRPSHVSAFRMVNELVTNAIRNAALEKPERKVMVLHQIIDTSANIAILAEDRNDEDVTTRKGDIKIYVVVADNGVGISDAAAAKRGERLRPDLADGTGAGLKTLFELAKREGWGFDISSDFNALNMPDALRARIQGMSTAAVLVIDIAGWGDAPGGGQKFKKIAGYEGDIEPSDKGANALSAGAKAMLLQTGQGSNAVGTNAQVPLNGATSAVMPVKLPVVP